MCETWASGISAGCLEQKGDSMIRVRGVNLDVIQSVARWPLIKKKSFGADVGKMVLSVHR